MPRRISEITAPSPIGFGAGLLVAIGLLILGAAAPAAAIDHPDTVELETLEMVPKRMWGVSGQTPQNTQTETLDVLVWDMVQSGDYMFVGGAFLNVQENKDSTPISQPYLAAFDIHTGDWVSSFTPSFDRAIYALEVLPNGSVLVGGEFETVNGTTRRGLVALDPITGQIDPSFAGAVDRPWSSRRATIRDMEVEANSGRIYVAGNFSHLEGAGGSRTQVSKAGRFANAAGVLDANWKPQVSGGAVWGLDTDNSRNEVVLSGFFTSVNAEAQTGHFHVVDDATGASVGGKIEVVKNDNGAQPETFDVVYGDDILFMIGEQHMVQVLDSDNHQRLGYHHTGFSNNGFQWSGGFAGGAYQAGEVIGDMVLAGCHCTSGSNNHYTSFTGRRTTQHNVMAYDISTGHHIEAFNPDIESPRDGFWAAASDTNGCIYLGGDFHLGGTEAGLSRWLGGFAKLCSPRPTNQVVDPGPQGLQVDVAASLQIEASGRGDLTLTYRANGLPRGLSIDSATGLISGTPTDVGQSQVTVTVGDVDGVAIEGSTTFSISVLDDVAPVLDPVDRMVVLERSTVSLQLIGSDTEGSALVWSATGLPAGLTVDAQSGLISGSAQPTGTYNVTATVTDAIGLSDSDSFELVVVEGAGEAAVESYSGFSTGSGSYFIGWQFTVDTELTIGELGAYDANGNGQLDNNGTTSVAIFDKATTQELGRVNVPANVVLEDGFGYEPLDTPLTVVPGKTYVVASETSGERFAYWGTLNLADDVNYAGYAYKSGSSVGYPNRQGTNGPRYFGAGFRIGADPTPVITDPADQTSPTGQSASLDLDAVIAPGLTGTWQAGGLPTGLSIDSDTGIISGTPTTPGQYTVTATVTDDVGLFDQTTFGWLILDGNPPALASIADRTVVESDALSIEPRLIQPEGGEVFTATGLPAGLTIDSATGLISGNATPDGVYTVTVTATDLLQLTASETFVITVINWDSTPAVHSMAGYQITTGNYFAGWQFTVDEAMNIADLGIFDGNSDGVIANDGSTSVGLYDKATQQLLGQVEVPADAAIEDGFAYAPLNQGVAVVPGRTYIVAAELSGEHYAYNGSRSYGEGINQVGYAYKGGSSLGWPGAQGSWTGGYFAATFRVRDDRPDIGGGGDEGPDPLLAAGSSWRYDDSGADLGSAWRQIGFDDDGWSSGPGILGFGDDDVSTAWQTGHVTYYARAGFNFTGDKPGSLELNLKADDGAIVYLNGVELLRDNLPDGPIDYRTGTLTWRSGDDEGFKRHAVTAAGLVEGTNVVAVEVHNVWSGSADLGFDLSITPADEVIDGEVPVELVAAGSTWSHADSSNGAPADWKQGLPADNVGTAEFGFGDDDETTVLTAGQEAYYFTRTFEVDNPADFAQLTLGLAADDGAVVYLNGVELQRVNMPDGDIEFNTRPITWVVGVDEELKEYVVASDALVAGTNVIAVEVHNLWPNNNDLSFDLYLK